MAIAAAAEQDTVARGAVPQPDDVVGINYGVARRGADGSLTFDYPTYPLGEAEIVAYDLPSIRARRIPGRRLEHYRAPFLARFIPTVAVPRPWAYLVTAPGIARKLQQHGVGYSELAAGTTVEVESYVVVGFEKTHSPDICTGIERFETVLTTRKELRSVQLPAGTLVVPTAQRLGNLIVYLLEPESDDGLARWEFFDPHVELGQPYPVYRLPRPTRLATQRPG
jgi:hypothetical protein